MFAGNAALLVLLAIMALKDSALLSFVSIGFWIVVALIVLARYVDVTRYNGTRTDGGTPATLRDVKRHGTRMVVIASAAWVLAHVL